MSGVEIVGLALGVVPLIITAAAAYREALDPVRAALFPKSSNSKLSEFYRGLLFEVTILNGMLSELFQHMPNQARPRSDSVHEDDSNMLDVLTQKLGDSNQAFMAILMNDMRLFEHLVSGSGVDSMKNLQVRLTCLSLTLKIAYFSIRARFLTPSW